MLQSLYKKHKLQSAAKNNPFSRFWIYSNRFFCFPSLLCNNACRHCLTIKSKDSIVSLDTIKSLILENKKFCTQVSIGGGEPTLYKDLFGLIKFCRQEHLRIQMHSNCRRMSDPGFALKIASCGLGGITVPLHSHSPQVHDYLTCKTGSFKQTLQGIRNLKKNGFCKIHAMVVLNRKNYRDIKKTAEFLSGLGLERISFDAMIFTGEGLKNRVSLGVRLKDISGYLSRAFDVLIEKKCKFYTATFPLCLFEKRYWKYFLNETSSMVITDLPQGQNNRFILKYQFCGLEIPPGCTKCRIRDFCPGTWNTYYKFFGSKEFIPELKMSISEILKLVSAPSAAKIFHPCYHQ